MANAKNDSKAERLADTIRRFWRDRGHDIDVRLRRYRFTGEHAAQFEIESNLVNGLPRGYRGLIGDLAIVATPPDPPDTSATRDCMSCGKSFESSGIGNRLCERCSQSASGTYAHEGRER